MTNNSLETFFIFPTSSVLDLLPGVPDGRVVLQLARRRGPPRKILFAPGTKENEPGLLCAARIEKIYSESCMTALEEQNESLTELERKAEKSRAELADTVGALHDRVTPDAIKADVKDYVQSKGQELYRQVERSARENPLQAVAIAAGLAYPLLRIVTAIPVPILLVGAGLALSRSSGAAGRGSSAGAQMTDHIKERADQLAQQVRDATDSAKSAVVGVAERVTDATKGLSSTISQGAETLKVGASEFVGKRVETVQQAGSEALAAASGALSAAYHSGADTVSRAGEQAVDVTRRSQDKLVDAIERHPLLVGGIGLAIGALIAGALPATRIENRAFGADSDELKSKIDSIAARSVDSAKAAAGEVYADTAREAEKQGLTPASVREAAGSLKEKATSALGRAMSETTEASTNSAPDRTS